MALEDERRHGGRQPEVRPAADGIAPSQQPRTEEPGEEYVSGAGRVDDSPVGTAGQRRIVMGRSTPDVIAMPPRAPRVRA